MKITTRGLTQLSILTAALFLNTACFGLFGNGAEPKSTSSSAVMPTSTVANPSLMQIAPECSDDLNANSACQKNPIKAKELKPKKLITKAGGEVHNLKSNQGQTIKVLLWLLPENNSVAFLEGQPTRLSDQNRVSSNFSNYFAAFTKIVIMSML